MRPIGSKVIAWSAALALILAACGSSASTPTAPAVATTSPSSAPPGASPSPAVAAVAAPASPASSVPSVEPSAAAAGASAGPSTVHQPDGAIRLGPYGYASGSTTAYQGPWLGGGIVNVTGASQTAIWANARSAMLAGTYYTFDISIRNAGSGADRFGVKATGAATNTWVPTYLRGTSNITSAIVAGTFQTPSLAPGATYLFSARITINQGGSLADHLVTITSAADPTKIDAVKFAFRWNSAVPTPSALGPQAVVQAFYDWYDRGRHSIADIVARPELTSGFVTWLKSFNGPASPIDCAQDVPAWVRAGPAMISGTSAVVKVDDSFSPPAGGIPVHLALGPTGWQISAIDCGF